MSSSDDDEYDPLEVVPVAAKREEPQQRPATSTTLPAEEGKTTGLPERPVPEVPTAPAAPAPAPADAKELDEGGRRLRSAIKGRVRDVCLNPSGTILCAAGEDGQFVMWDFTVPLESRRLWPTRTLTPFVNRISGLQPIVALHASVDGSYFVACQDGDAPALIAASGKQLGSCAMGERGFVDVVQCKGHRAPVTCSSPHAVDGGAFYTGGQDGTARLWKAASYERRSVYAVKHGSGQINDTVVVESVLGLSAAMGGDGDLFATGGADGLVQVWDARVKYRPGGAAASWNAHSLAYSERKTDAGMSAKKAAATDFAAFDIHVGGMAEVKGGASSLLAVRLGAELKCVDLRKPFAKGGILAFPAVTDLGYVLDTTAVRCCSGAATAASSSFYTCTDRTGYHHIVGGHVLQYDAAGPALSCTSAWRAGHPDEDALCVAVDAATEDVFCGLSTGAVVVNVGNRAESHFMRWLDTRPVSDAVMRKRAREDAADDAPDAVTGADNLF